MISLLLVPLLSNYSADSPEVNGKPVGVGAQFDLLVPVARSGTENEILRNTRFVMNLHKSNVVTA